MPKISGENGWVLVGDKLTIANMTVNNPLSVSILTDDPHGLTSDNNGDYVYISGVTTVSGVNGSRKITNVSGASTVIIETENASGTYSGDADYLQRAFKITGWNLDQASEVLDVTDSESSDDSMEFIPSDWVEWEGSFDCFFENDDSRGAPYLEKDSIVDIRLCLTSAEDDEYFDGECIITSEGDVIEIVGTNAAKATFQFKGTDTLTKT